MVSTGIGFKTATSLLESLQVNKCLEVVHFKHNNVGKSLVRDRRNTALLGVHAPDLLALQVSDLRAQLRHNRMRYRAVLSTAEGRTVHGDAAASSIMSSSIPRPASANGRRDGSSEPAVPWEASPLRLSALASAHATLGIESSPSRPKAAPSALACGVGGSDEGEAVTNSRQGPPSNCNPAPPPLEARVRALEVHMASVLEEQQRQGALGTREAKVVIEAHSHEIERLQQENEKLRAALQEAQHQIEGQRRSVQVRASRRRHMTGGELTLGRYRRACHVRMGVQLGMHASRGAITALEASRHPDLAPRFTCRRQSLPRVPGLPRVIHRWCVLGVACPTMPPLPRLWLP